MLIVKIIDKENPTDVFLIPVADFSKYCQKKNWEYDIIKQHFNTRIHYQKKYFQLIDEPDTKPEVKKKVVKSRTKKEQVKPLI